MTYSGFNKKVKNYRYFRRAVIFEEALLSEFYYVYLLTEWEGQVGKYLARGRGRRDRGRRGLYNLTEPSIFPSGLTSLSQQAFDHMTILDFNLYYFMCKEC